MIGRLMKLRKLSSLRYAVRDLDFFWGRRSSPGVTFAKGLLRPGVSGWRPLSTSPACESLRPLQYALAEKKDCVATLTNLYFRPFHSNPLQIPQPDPIEKEF